jgi:endonuclease YncB( thermonuclease family)
VASRFAWLWIALDASVLHQEVSASCSKIDRYRREVCTLRRDGADLNLALLRAGLAWHDLAYVRDQSPGDVRA